MKLKGYMMKHGVGALVLLAPLLASTCQGRETMKKMTITSPAFQPGEKIPPVHTCTGNDESPALQWDNLPATTKSLALIMDDPDAPHGTFVHWVAWNIDPTKQLPQKVTASSTLLAQGINSFNKSGYGGPCPPSGQHRYFFKLYAVDTKLNLPPSTQKDDLIKALAGHIIAEAELMGTYQKDVK